MRIAIPVTNQTLSSHFGHCEAFSIFDVSPDSRAIVNQTTVDAPPHEPGLLPAWLAQHKVKLIIAGGMGSRAQDLFTQQGIEVIIGAPSHTPEQLVQDYLSGTLTSGDNLCDH